MISTNQPIIDFVTGNAVGLALLAGLLKGWSRLSKNVWDDKVSTLFGQLLRIVPKPTNPEKPINNKERK